jgi:hypothetical protein
VSDPDDIDAKETARAQAAAEAGCARLLALLRQHHPKMKMAGPAGKAGTDRNIGLTGHDTNISPAPRRQVSQPN